MFQALEEKIAAVWHQIDGEAEADLKDAKAEVDTALADVKAQVAQAGPILTEFETGLKGLLAGAEPQIKTDGEALLAKLLSDFAPLLGKVASGL